MLHNMDIIPPMEESDDPQYAQHLGDPEKANSAHPGVTSATPASQHDEVNQALHNKEEI